MVSGLVTSPCDQLRIFSGDARLMRMASKSASGFAISNGLERNMFLRFPALRGSGQWSVASCQFLVFRSDREPEPRETFPLIFVRYQGQGLGPAGFHWPP